MLVASSLNASIMGVICDAVGFGLAPDIQAQFPNAWRMQILDLQKHGQLVTA